MKDEYEALHIIAAKNGELHQHLTQADETIAILRGQVSAFTAERDAAENARRRAVILQKQAETQTTRVLKLNHQTGLEIAYLQAKLQQCKEMR